MTPDVQIASLLSARICHDLVSPVGAVVNGIGLVQEIAGASLADELSMIGQSADRASSMLQFYRIAFGSGDVDGAEVSRRLVDTHAGHLIASSKVTFRMDGADGAPLRRDIGKIFCLMILCAKSLVGLRGSVHASLDPPVQCRMRVEVQTDNVLSNPDYLDVLQSSVEPKDIPPRAVEFLLLNAAAAQSNVEINVTSSERHASISLI